MKRYTHAIAVGAHIITEMGVLLLFRSTPPIAWAPPGGRLHKHEDPLQGLHREVNEECNVQVKIVCPTTIWYGMHKQMPTIGIFFFCKIISGHLNLSSEHTAAKWFTLQDVHQQYQTDNNSIAFGTYADYEKAFLIAKVYS